MKYNHRLDKVRNHIQQFFANKDVTPLIYHNLAHTEFVVSSAAKIANHYGLDDRDSFIVGTAAWFHDTGYYNGPALRHEERGADLAAEYLAQDGIDNETIEAVRGCILATHIPQSPKNLLEQIVGDADLFHFGTDDFSKKNKLVRKEMEVRLGMEIDKDKWREKTILMMEKHSYHTDYCRTILTPTKEKNIAKLKEKAQKAPENKQFEVVAEPVKEHTHEGKSEVKSESKSEIKSEGKKDKSDRPEKGIETMFRISSNNHQRLSDMADNKAHIMITTTSIIISVLLSILIRKLEDNSYLIIPTTLLLTICVITMVFSILATRPTIPRGVFTEEEIENKNVNLLFFGNFYRMPFTDYSNGMKAMMADRDFLYGSLTKDVYSQGVVLGRKYRLLRIAYNVFMFGIVASVISFVIASLFFGPY